VNARVPGLAERMRGRVVLVGIGNPLRGDDAAGCLLARMLAGAPGLSVVVSDDVPERDVLAIADAHPDVVVLADALDLGLAPGSVALVETAALAGYAPTTHRVPLALLADILRHASGADVLVLGIQPRQVEPGTVACEEVRAAVAALADQVREWAQEHAAPAGHGALAEGACRC
jgi:hydrogenase 3 maturation protease